MAERWVLRKTWMASGVLAAAMMALACGQKDVDLEQASRDYVAHFQTEADRGAFAGLYADSAPTMKAAASEDAFVSLLTRVQEAMGERREATYLRSEPAEMTDGSPLTRLVYTTVFDKGTGEESFFFQNVAGKPRLFHYHLEAPTLRALPEAQPSFDDPFGQAVLASVARFHAQVAADDVEGIYDAGAPGMKEGVTRERFAAAVRRVQRALGERGTSTPASRTTTQSDTGIPLMLVEMRSRFGDGEGTERFYLQHVDGNALLYRYEVFSDRLTPAVMQEEDVRAAHSPPAHSPPAR